MALLENHTVEEKRPVGWGKGFVWISFFGMRYGLRRWDYLFPSKPLKSYTPVMKPSIPSSPLNCKRFSTSTRQSTYYS